MSSNSGKKVNKAGWVPHIQRTAAVLANEKVRRIYVEASQEAARVRKEDWEECCEEKKRKAGLQTPTSSAKRVAYSEHSPNSVDKLCSAIDWTRVINLPSASAQRQSAKKSEQSGPKLGEQRITTSSQDEVTDFTNDIQIVSVMGSQSGSSRGHVQVPPTPTPYKRVGQGQPVANSVSTSTSTNNANVKEVNVKAEDAKDNDVEFPRIPENVKIGIQLMLLNSKGINEALVEKQFHDLYPDFRSFKSTDHGFRTFETMLKSHQMKTHVFMNRIAQQPIYFGHNLATYQAKVMWNPRSKIFCIIPVAEY